MEKVAIKAYVKWRKDVYSNKHPILVFPNTGYLCMCYQCQQTVKLQRAIGKVFTKLPKGGETVEIPLAVIKSSGSKTLLAKKLLQSYGVISDT
jgi:hypothetical protein